MLNQINVYSSTVFNMRTISINRVIKLGSRIPCRPCHISHQDITTGFPGSPKLCKSRESSVTRQWCGGGWGAGWISVKGQCGGEWRREWVKEEWIIHCKVLYRCLFFYHIETKWWNHCEWYNGGGKLSGDPDLCDWWHWRGSLRGAGEWVMVIDS